MIKTVKAKVLKAFDRITCHRAVYGQLSGAHGYAAFVTGKPEVYVPMMVLYAVLAVRP